MCEDMVKDRDIVTNLGREVNAIKDNISKND